MSVFADGRYSQRAKDLLLALSDIESPFGSEERIRIIQDALDFERAEAILEKEIKK